jgi:hypothetical protein
MGKEEKKRQPTQIDGQHFASDMLLPHANQWMTELTQQLFDGAGHEAAAAATAAAAAAAASAASSLRAPLLSGILQGGAFAYVGIEGEVQLPHGVADWITTHHQWNRPTPSRHHSSQAGASYFPHYFHCESHRAGVVHWRIDDLLPKTTSASSRSSSSTVEALPAYWLCVEPEPDNIGLFQEVMSVAAAAEAVADAASSGCRRKGKVARVSSFQYSIDDLHTHSVRSIEPFLRAGVRMQLVTQHERELVILMPGTPHCVFTPPAAAQVSRNWMTPQALLAASVRALRGTSGPRGEWIRDMQERPLHCLLPALRRMCVVEPEQFHRLATHPISHSHLSFALSRAKEDDTLQTVASQIASRMQHCVSQTDAASAARTASAQPSCPQQSDGSAAVAMDISDSAAAASASATSAADDYEGGGHAHNAFTSSGGGEAAGSTPAAASATMSSSSFLPRLHLSEAAQQGLLTSVATRCQVYREVLLERLRQECPLTSTLRMLDGLLLASVPSATVQELCTELDVHGSSTTMQETVQAMNTAHRQRHVRGAKLQRQAAAEQGVHAALQAKFQQDGVEPPDMWHKMIEFKQRLEAAVPQQQHPPRMSLMEWRAGSTAQLSKQQLQLYRRLLLQELAAFIDPSACVPGEALLVFAAPEVNNLLRWRVILCGSVFHQRVPERDAAAEEQ